MKNTLFRNSIILISVIMLIFAFFFSLSEESVFIFDATKDLAPLTQGERNDGDKTVVNDFFTIIHSAKNKIDASTKTFNDGYFATQRLNFGGKTQPGKGMINSVSFTVDSPSTVKFWWVSGGDGREFALYDEKLNEIFRTQTDSIKNSLYISSFPLESQGTYYLGVPNGSNYLFKIEVTTGVLNAEKPPREDWSNVLEPIFLSVDDRNDGKIAAEVFAEVGYNGADELLVSMFDEEGNEIDTLRSIQETDIHTFEFKPSRSGTYTFKAILNREDESPLCSYEETVSFVLPLSAPQITGITNKGNGSALIVFTSVSEADQYDIYAGGEYLASCKKTQCLLEGLEIGKTYSISVCAKRGNEESQRSTASEILITSDAEQEWYFTVFGPSTNKTDNGYIGSVNGSGSVTVYSENGKGKIQPNADDGIAFYYTRIPSDQNFTLRSDVHVDSWEYSNGQEGFGLMTADSVPETGAKSFFTNSYMALATKVEYYISNGAVSTSGQKYSMRLGLGALSKLGRTGENTASVPGVMFPLETSAQYKFTEGVANYNIIGNNKNKDVLDKTSVSINELTDFTLEIQKNNTGYFITYYDENGSVIGRVKDYDPKALEILDSDYVYAGFFAARNARATFSNIVLSMISPEDDLTKEERPVIKIKPTIAITSGETSNKANYTLSCVTNANGEITIKVDGDVYTKDLKAVKEIRNDYTIYLPRNGETYIEVIFAPYENQTLHENTVIASTNKIYSEIYVTYTSAYASLSEIYVSPLGTPSGRGTKESPLNLTTAVKYALPGQKIFLSEGVYNFIEPVRIPHGIDGTMENPIIVMPAPDAEERPVLNFKSLSAGIIHGGDFWIFEGFDVTGSANGQKGFQVSGHNNILKDIHAYKNGNTGIQISRYSGNDPVSEWPSGNLILNCTSWANADAGYEDADGFAAKLTCGEGNVFDGCIAYNNADDGFDLYAKLETGPIGKVVIRNSVAYLNGILPDGTIGGNGNGFKMGGSNMPGGHSLINSYAFFNRSKGIDSNSCPDLYVENCVSYNNLRYNVAFYTNLEQDTAFVSKNLVSFKDASIASGDMSEEDEFKTKGNQNPSDYLNATNYYWNGAESVNGKGDVFTEDMFVSLSFKGVDRNDDGSINLHGFLEIKKDK